MARWECVNLEVCYLTMLMIVEIGEKNVTHNDITIDIVKDQNYTNNLNLTNVAANKINGYDHGHWRKYYSQRYSQRHRGRLELYKQSEFTKCSP